MTRISWVRVRKNRWRVDFGSLEIDMEKKMGRVRVGPVEPEYDLFSYQFRVKCRVKFVSIRVQPEYDTVPT